MHKRRSRNTTPNELVARRCIPRAISWLTPKPSSQATCRVSPPRRSGTRWAGENDLAAAWQSPGPIVERRVSRDNETFRDAQDATIRRNVTGGVDDMLKF